MPGLFGQVGINVDSHVETSLAAMAQSMHHHPWYRREIWIDPNHRHAALGRLALDSGEPTPQPIVHEEKQLVCFLSGEIYETDKHRQRLTGQGARFATQSSAEVVLQGYACQGIDFFAQVEGLFVAALWDRTRQRFMLINDRFGMKPLYFAHSPGLFLFAAEIKALLCNPHVPRAPSHRGIIQFFTFGQLLGEDTFLDAVRLQPAGSCLTYDQRADLIETQQYWRMQSSKTLSAAAATEQVDSAFCRAVQRRTTGDARLGISLSGGLDARTILAVIDTAQTPVTAVSMGIPGSIDLDSAARMAQVTHSPFHACILDDVFLGEYERHLREMIWQTDGHYLSECVVRPTLPTYRRLGIQALLRGHAGELMHLDKAYNYSFNGAVISLQSETEVQEWLWKHLRTFVQAPADAPIFTPEFQREAEALARDSLQACWRETAGVKPLHNRIAALFLSQRSRRETAMSMVEFGTLVEPRLPYLDGEVVQTLLDAPPQVKIGDALQRHILERHRPEFLKVVNANTGTTMGAGAMRRFWAKTKLRVFSKLGVRGYQPYERIGLWLRRELRPLVQNVLLSKRCRERGIFDPAGVRAVIDQHGSKRRNHTYLLLALLIFEMGQRIFVDGEDAVSPHTATAA